MLQFLIKTKVIRELYTKIAMTSPTIEIAVDTTAVGNWYSFTI